MASIACAQENYPTPIEYFQRVLSLPYENGDSWNALGHCLLIQDDLRNAYSTYQQALYYFPNPELQDPKLRSSIRILYDCYGFLRRAEEAFSSVLLMGKDFDKANQLFFLLHKIFKLLLLLINWCGTCLVVDQGDITNCDITTEHPYNCVLCSHIPDAHSLSV